MIVVVIMIVTVFLFPFGMTGMVFRFEIPFVPAVTNEGLTLAIALVAGVFLPVNICMQVRPGFIDYHFVATVQINTSEAGRQGGGKQPTALFEINKLAAFDVIVTINIG
jgi:hypothetical protein